MEHFKSEAKMNHFQNQQTWEIMNMRHAEMLQEVCIVRLARMATNQQQKQHWWTNLFRRPTSSPTIVLNPTVLSEAR
jgi:hypothetical protein